MEEICEIILSNFLRCNLEISPPGDINLQFPLPLSYHIYLVLNADTPIAKRNRFKHSNLSNGVEYFRNLNSRPTDFHAGFKDHKNRPKVLQGITNLPAKHCRAVATPMHVQTCKCWTPGSLRSMYRVSQEPGMVWLPTLPRKGAGSRQILQPLEQNHFYFLISSLVQG